MKNPLVSVLLPVYNGEPFLRASIVSILEQSFDDFEFIIINDGSTDGSAAIIDSFKDPRIVAYHQVNIGLAATLNKGLFLAKGKYIARQDQDDLSLPQRFAKQVAYLNANPDCKLLGTAASIWVEEKQTRRSHVHSLDHEALQFDLLFVNPFVHSSVMMDRSYLISLGGYCEDSSRQPPEDYELWSRMVRSCRIGNLSDKLLVYREVKNSMSRTAFNPFQDALVKISSENLAYANNVSRPNAAMLNAAALYHSEFDKLSNNFSIRDVLEVVQSASRLLTNSDGLALARVHKVKKRILLQYFIYKYRIFHLAKWVRIARRFVLSL